MFSLRSGGWVLLAALVLTVAGTLWNLAPLFDAKRPRPRGDGRTADSYGFDLSTTLVAREKIVSAGMVTDGLAPLIEPKTIHPAELPEHESSGRGRFLVSSDKIVGVVVEDRARAYPLRVLVWHEVIDDTIAGSPIAVTYSPLSGGIAVFDRRVAGDTLTFGVSGLLFQSNLLMYDRRPDRVAESLWSQLQARAVAGPAARAKRTLVPLPFALARWSDWLREHPDTSILAPVPGESAQYAEDVYGSYLNSEELRFPVDPLPPEGTLARKCPVHVVGRPGAWTVTPLFPSPGESRFEVVGPAGATPIVGVYAFWFAWYATHADDPGAIAAAAASSPERMQSGKPNAPATLPAR